MIEVSKQAEKIMIVTGAASSDITGKSCSPYTAHWTYDTYANSHIKHGGDTWFFVTVDYAFGHAVERDTSDVVKAAGGKVLGSVKHPLNAPDFSSYLLQRPRSSVLLTEGATPSMRSSRPANSTSSPAGKTLRRSSCSL
jgi:branched-chain amino acid transport system substrate-binding protein